MKLAKALLIGMMICSASLFAQDSTVSFSGMAKITLTDGRTLYGAVNGEYALQRNRAINHISLRFTSEPTLVQFEDESKFNSEFEGETEIGITGSMSRDGRSVITAIIPQFGSMSIMSAGRLRDSEWALSDRRIDIDGTPTGFNISIQ